MADILNTWKSVVFLFLVWKKITGMGLEYPRCKHSRVQNNWNGLYWWIAHIQCGLSIYRKTDLPCDFWELFLLYFLLYQRPCIIPRLTGNVWHALAAMRSSLSHDMTKPTKWVCAQRRLRSDWADAQADQSLRCAFNGELRTQALIRLGRCPGWFESSLPFFFAVYTFFVGTADEKCIVFTVFVGDQRNFDEKCINYFWYIFFCFQLRRIMYKYFCKLGTWNYSGGSKGGSSWA